MTLFPTSIRVRCEPELREAVFSAARRDRRSTSEFLRQKLREAVEGSDPVQRPVADAHQ